jgi:predicted Zn-dependent peptidase
VTNATLVVVGDLDPDAVRAVVDRSVRRPPSRPGDAPPSPPSSLRLPVDDRVPAPVAVSVYGYALDEADGRLCDALASAVELRAVRALYVERPLVSSVSVECQELHRRRFVLGFAVSRSPEGGELREALERVFAGVAREGPSPSEQRLLADRAARRLARQRWDASYLAELLARRVLWPAGAGAAAARFDLAAPPAGEGDALRAAAARAFQADRQVVITLTPFAQ